MASIVEILSREENGSWHKYDDIILKVLDDKDEKNVISFISYKGSQQLINDDNKGFCHSKFKANFTIDNMEVEDLTVGQVLSLGNVNINIRKIGKPCYSNCPVMKKKKTSCLVNEQIFWGEVLNEGIVNIKDNIRFI